MISASAARTRIPTASHKAIKVNQLKLKKLGQRIGRIRLDRKWDAVLLVLLNEDFEAIAIYEADRSAVEEAIKAPGSRARNERGALGVQQFKKIGRRIWPIQ